MMANLEARLEEGLTMQSEAQLSTFSAAIAVPIVDQQQQLLLPLSGDPQQGNQQCHLYYCFWQQISKTIRRRGRWNIENAMLSFDQGNSTTNNHAMSASVKIIQEWAVDGCLETLHQTLFAGSLLQSQRSKNVCIGSTNNVTQMPNGVQNYV